VKGVVFLIVACGMPAAVQGGYHYVTRLEFGVASPKRYRRVHEVAESATLRVCPTPILVEPCGLVITLRSWGFLSCMGSCTGHPSQARVSFPNRSFRRRAPFGVIIT
jgi:hypothetical protein